MYIVAINGSPNKDGNCAFLLNEIKKHCGDVDFEIINAAEAVNDAKTPFCTTCATPCQRACYKGSKLEYAYNKIEEADFVIFASPVYFGSMSAQLKAFFDKTRAVRAEKRWLGKPMAAVSGGASKYGGQERTIDHIHSCAMVSGMNIFGNGSQIVMGHFGVSAQRPASEDEYAIKQCESIANAILSLKE